jgi:hypothetical protein
MVTMEYGLVSARNYTLFLCKAYRNRHLPVLEGLRCDFATWVRAYNCIIKCCLESWTVKSQKGSVWRTDLPFWMIHRARKRLCPGILRAWRGIWLSYLPPTLTTKKDSLPFGNESLFIGERKFSEMGEHRTQIGRTDSLVDFMDLGRGMVNEPLRKCLRYFPL